MKLTLVALALFSAGCAAQPLTFEQRMQLVRVTQANRYVLPPPPVLTVPQTQGVRCTGSGNSVYCQ